MSKMTLTNPQLVEALAESRRKANRVDPAEWAMRVELAACYRLVAHFRMTDWVYNHISAAIPGSPDHYLINPFGLLYEEVSASNLVKVDVNGNLVDDDPYDVNPAAFVIHGAIHQARPDAVCVLHTHTAAGVAVSAQAEGLLPLSQHALRFHDRVAYHGFEGIALDLDEQRRLVQDLGAKKVLILRNHGLLTVGKTVGDAFKEMFFLERACQIQVAALAGNRPMTLPPPEVCEHTASQFDNDASFLQGRDWRALLRLLDRIDPSYKE
ncbi:class II aldolase/adducin family protein [Variovorax sp. J22R24]|uniref:class II aldolase/adducin family protein n=1 Tax=Variovorax gracilis TaxID=3053502 RepID=UPI002575381F|nr:class II aldolase/adducin family protein [Variovorax sp. J22R24]MDM0106597.1 class II aldolase/adducin family protein [Variovorax sp. J22R24]